jgi:hypothetical protein
MSPPSGTGVKSDGGAGGVARSAASRGTGTWMRALCPRNASIEVQLWITRGVVGEPLAGCGVVEAGRDQEESIHALECGRQGLRVSVAGGSDPHAPLGQVGDLARGAHDGDDVGSGHAESQQLLNGEAPELSGARTRRLIAETVAWLFAERGYRWLSPRAEAA